MKGKKQPGKKQRYSLAANKIFADRLERYLKATGLSVSEALRSLASESLTTKGY